jgi:hypothetical protein
MNRDNRPLAAVAEGGDATGPDVPGESWVGCQIFLVAHRTPGSTHTFFHDWRFEVVTCTGDPKSDATLLTISLDAGELARSGWRYEMLRLEARPGPLCQDRTVFSWAATTTADTPDPLAAGLERARVWLAAGGWERDPADATRYAKHPPVAEPTPA